MASQALLAFFATLNRSSLGVVSNNPGNLVSNSWTQSLPGYRSRNLEGFAVFATPGDGIDALQLNLRSYGDKGLNTPFKIASAWAPEGQPGNDPIAYAETIAKQVGVGPYAVINLASQATLDAVTMGIMLQENGLAPRRFSMRLNFPPQLGMALGALMTSLGAIGTATAQLTTLFGDGDAKIIAASVSLTCIALGPFVTVLSAGSNSTPGPLATQDAPVVLAAQAVANLPPDATQASITATKANAKLAVDDHQP